MIADFPTTLGAEPIATATAIAQAVKENGFDGVDVNYEGVSSTRHYPVISTRTTLAPLRCTTLTSESQTVLTLVSVDSIAFELGTGAPWLIGK